MKKLVCAVTVLAVSTAEAGVVIHVDAGNCPGPGDGSELDPYCSIQTAIDNAVDTDEIIVAPGTYFETINFLGKAIPLRSSDGPDVTIIDAQGSGTPVTCESGEGPGTVVEGFTLTGGAGTGITDGSGMQNISSSPTVTDCTLTQNTAAFGGGMSNFFASNPTVTNCTFSSNVATLAHGGGMYNIQSNPTVIDCTFTNNFAGTSGGGMFNLQSSPTVTNGAFNDNTALLAGGGMANADSTPTVTGCTFEGNEADKNGGGMFNGQNSRPTVTDCSFTSNLAGEGDDDPFQGGAGMCNDDSSPVVTDCTFMTNVAEFGGGMYNIGSSPIIENCVFTENNDLFAFGSTGAGLFSWSSSTVVSDCTFSSNGEVGVGGAIALVGGDLAVLNCTFEDNVSGGGGGAIWQGGATLTMVDSRLIGNGGGPGGGGALLVHQNGTATLINCLLAANVALAAGGAVFNWVGTVNLINCTVAGNFSPANCAIRNEDTLTVHNCVVWGNVTEQQVCDFSGQAFVSYSNVQGGWPGIGNVDTDPLFVDPDTGDFRLLAGSPCIDAGDNTAVPEDVTTDLDGNPRFLEIPETPDTGNGDLPIVDMGAYESLGGGCLAVISQEVVCHADGTTFTVNIEGLNACTGGTTQVTFTGSGGAVGEELCFTALVSDGGFCCSTEICITIPDCTPVGQPSDLDGDGVVGMVDFLALLGAWGSCSDCDNCPADFDGDCSVGILDLLILLGNWG